MNALTTDEMREEYIWRNRPRPAEEAAAEFDAWMDGLRSEGWERGYQDSYDEARQWSTFGRTDNPYRRADR